MRARPSKGGRPWWYARPFYLLLFKGFLLTIAAAAAAFWLAIVEGPNISGLYDNHVSGAQSIRERNHIFLIPPE